jgi:hypothetical protein
MDFISNFVLISKSNSNYKNFLAQTGSVKFFRYFDSAINRWRRRRRAAEQRSSDAPAKLKLRRHRI